jgi:hypothetical protein
VKIADHYKKSARANIIGQIVTILIMSSVYDGGELFRSSVIAAPAFWTGFLIVMFRRPATPHATDRTWTRFGYLICFAACFFCRTVILGR